MGRFIYLQNSYGGPPAPLGKVVGHHFDYIQQYEADRLDWTGYDAVLLSMSVDQIHLCEITDKIAAYLDQGGTLVTNGHITRPFLPKLRPFEPLEARRQKDLVVHRAADHPIFRGVTSEMLSLRRGVAGFYGRGHNPPPAGAEVINIIGDVRAPIDWIWQRPAGGRVFSHGGLEFWNVLMLEGAAGLPFVQQTFDWFAATSMIGGQK